MPTPTSKYSPSRKESLTVKSYDVWQDGRLKLSALLNYFQEVASNHATSLGWGFENMQKTGVFWALHRIEIHINQLPSWEDNATASTWIKGTERLFARRDFSLADQNGEVLVRAASAWLMVDTHTKRPKNPAIIMDGMPQLSNSEDIPLSYDKLKPFETPIGDMTRKVFPSELDLNQHVNNARYADWLMDAYTPDFLHSHRLNKVTILYLMETQFADEIRISITKSSENENIHILHLSRESDEKVVLQAMIEWQKN